MDREKVINDLNIVKLILCNPQMLTPRMHIRIGQAITSAIAMLKEQEAVEPYSMNAERTYGICPQCGKIIFRFGNVEENHYCGVCGKKVKWE